MLHCVKMKKFSIKKLLKFSYAAPLLMLGYMLWSAPVASASPASNLAATDVNCSVIPQGVCDKANICTLEDSGTWQLLLLILSILTVCIGIVAIGIVGYAGFLYASSSSSPDQVAQAKVMLRNVAIAIAAYGAMYVFLQWLIPGGIFEPGARPTASVECKEEEPPARPPIPSDNDPSDKTVGYCYELTQKNRPKGDLYHVHGSTPYARENSKQGIDDAIKGGYKRIDLDLNVTKDGVIVVTHSQDPLNRNKRWGGFYDPAGKIKKSSTKIYNLTYAQVKRLRHADGYQIYSLEEMIAYASGKDITLLLELKMPKVIKPMLPNIAHMLNQYKVKAAFIGLYNSNAYARSASSQASALAYARKLGFWTRNITADKWSGPDLDADLCKRLNS